MLRWEAQQSQLLGETQFQMNGSCTQPAVQLKTTEVTVTKMTKMTKMGGPGSRIYLNARLSRFENGPGAGGTLGLGLSGRGDANPLPNQAYCAGRVLIRQTVTGLRAVRIPK